MHSEEIKRDRVVYMAMIYSRIRSIVGKAVLGFLLFFPLFSNAQEDTVLINTGAMDVNYSKKVLILNSYHQGYPWTDRMTKSILDKFIDRDINVQVHIENMDTKRILNKKIWLEFLRQKLDSYPKGYLDLIIVSDDNALYSLYKIGHHYHSVPIVYCGVAEDMLRHADTCSMFIGVEEYLPFKENIELGLKLFPKTEHVAIVTDKSKTGISHYYSAREAIRGMDTGDLDLIWINGYNDISTPEMMHRLETLPENTIVIFAIWQIDGDNRYWDPIKYYPEYSRVSNSPIFTVVDIGIENAFVGGKVTIPENQGELAAELGIQLLYGELLEDLPRLKDKTEYYFNWEELNRWNIKIRDLPRGSSILNKPETVYNQYRTFFFLTLSLIILMFVLFWLLLLYHFRYRNYEAQRTEMTNWTKRLANRYNILFEQTYNAIMIFNLTTGIVADSNEKAIELFGVQQDSLEGFSLKEYFPNYEEMKDNIEDLLKEPFEMKMAKADKSSFHARIILNLLREENNDYIYAIINDITQRKEQEEEIRVSKARLNETLQNSKNCYWEWDLVNHTLEKDDNFWLALDIDPQTLKENPSDSNYYVNSIHPDDKDLFFKIINEAIDGKKETILHELRMSFFGKNTWVEIRGVVAKRDKKGKGLAINGFMMNIDDRKYQEKELIKAKEKAEESDRLKSAFISNISHEIRTPLNGIVGFSNLLGRENLSLDEKRKYLAFINENNDLLLKLINDILEISKIETGTVVLNEESCNLQVICENILAQESINLSPTVTMQLSNIQNINIQLDKIRLTQVLRNLLSNARKFTQKGTIELGCSLKRDIIEFYVSDTGIGIQKDMQEKIFERFVKVDPFSSGTGLGLSISKALIEKMGGKIWVESEPDVGTTAHFTIKYRKANINIAEIEPIITKSVKDENADQKHTMVIAEDGESSFVLLNVILKGKFKIIRTLNMDDMQNAVREYHPDILIVNTDMLGFNAETMIEVRNLNDCMPVIGISDTTPDAQKSKELANILDKHLSKPINIKSLMEALDEQLGTE